MELTKDQDVQSKYIVFQAPLLNRGSIWLGDDARGVAQREGILFRPGEKQVFDIDSDRPVGMYLKNFVFAGDYGGDKLVVAFLEEVQDGQD